MAHFARMAAVPPLAADAPPLPPGPRQHPVLQLLRYSFKPLEFLEQAAAGGHSPLEIQNEPELIALRRDPGYARVARSFPESKRR